MAELDAAARWHAADESCKVLAHSVALAENAVRGAVANLEQLLKPTPHVVVSPEAKKAAVAKHTAAFAALKAAEAALEAEKQKAWAGHAEVRTATATALAPALKAGCQRRIELAAKAEDLRRQLAEIEDEAKAAMAE